jgi:hypothetical protein
MNYVGSSDIITNKILSVNGKTLHQKQYETNLNNDRYFLRTDSVPQKNNYLMYTWIYMTNIHD